MVTLVKHEYHSVDVQYAMELDKDLLAEIYPDMDEDELTNLLERIASGQVDIDEIINDAYDNDVELEWDHQYDDMWTMRKGGYDMSYELGDESSWHSEPPLPEPTHKCSKCKWNGREWDAERIYGNELEESKLICPYCESDVVLTEHGIEEKQKSEKRREEIKKMLDENDE